MSRATSFTSQEDDDLRELRRRKHSFEAIAKVLGKHVTTVSERWEFLKTGVRRASSLAMRKPAPARVIKTWRICISCGGVKFHKPNAEPEHFLSDGPHHRMCNHCRLKADEDPRVVVHARRRG